MQKPESQHLIAELVRVGGVKVNLAPDRSVLRR